MAQSRDDLRDGVPGADDGDQVVLEELVLPGRACNGPRSPRRRRENFSSPEIVSAMSPIMGPSERSTRIVRLTRGEGASLSLRR